jgi:hypothetical protein
VGGVGAERTGCESESEHEKIKSEAIPASTSIPTLTSLLHVAR